MIYKKLSQIQARLFVPKNQKNDFGKYNYRSCEDILKTVKPICEELGCVLYITNDIKEVGGRVYVEAVCHLKDLEDDTEITSTAHAREEESKKGMDGSQISGSCSSYARKYALAGLFCIDNEKDSDATNKGEQAPEDVAKLKMEVLKQLEKLEEKTKGYIKNVCEHYKVDSPAKLSPENCKDLLNTWKKKG